MEEMRVTYLDLDNFICEYPSNPRIKKAVIKRDIDTTRIKNIFVDSADKAAIKYELTDGSVVKEESIETHIEFEKVDGSSIRHIIPKWFEPLYMRQYGVNISDDGELFFMHDWYARGGLSCYEVDTGRLRWRVKIKHARQAYVNNDHIICGFEEYGILKIMLQSGEIVARYPYGEANLYRLNKNCYLVGPKAKTFRIINSFFEELYRIPYRVLEPWVYGTFIISGELQDDQLTTHGHEETEEEHKLFYSYMRMKDSGVMNETIMARISELAAAQGLDAEHYNFYHEFSRTIDISQYAVKKKC